MGLTQVLSNKQLGKLARRVFFTSLSFGGKFKINASSPT
jgi:hypothetical protein